MRTYRPLPFLLTFSLLLALSSGAPAQVDCLDYADHPALNSGLGLPGFTKAMAPTGNHLFVAAGLEGLQIIEISDPSLPRKVGSVPSSGQAFDVTVDGNLLFLADGFAGLQILALDDPASPAFLGSMAPGGKVRAVQAAGNFAYLAITDGTGSLAVIDITDPANPLPVGQLSAGSSARDIEINGPWAYLLDEDGTLAVIDISNPALPFSTATIQVADTALAMDLQGSLLAVAAYLEGVVMVDLSSPAFPQIVGSLVPQARTSTFVTEVHLTEGRGFCVTNDDEVVVFDVDDPAQPRQLTSLPLPEAGAAVTVHQGSLMATMGSSGLHITLDNGFDLPLPVGDLAPYERFAPGPMVVDSGFAFVASDQLKAVRISVPTHPQLVASRAAGETNYDLTLAGGHGYLVCDPFNQILIYDLTNPQSPVQTGQINLAGNHPDLVQAHDGYLYSGPHSSNLGVFDLALPQAPALLDYLDASRPFSSMTVQGDSLYLGSFGQVGIFDLSNPAVPVAVATIDAYNTVQGLAVAGRHVFMLTEAHGLDIADLDQPGHPVVGHYPAAHAVHVTVHQGVAYLSDAQSGLHVLDLADITAPRLLGIKRGGCVSTAIEGDHLIASGSGYLGGVEILPLQCTELSPVTDHQTPAHSPILTAYPNPFNPSTTVSFRCAKAEPVTLTIHDALGKKVRRLVSEHWYAAGRHEVIWNGRDSLGRLAASGVYFVHLKVGPQKSVLPVTLLK